MKRMTGLFLLAFPFLFGQMCGFTEPIPDDQNPPPADGGNGQEQPPPLPARTVSGPGFSLQIPAGFQDFGSQARDVESFAHAYGDGARLIVLSVETPLPGGPHNFSSNTIRIRGAHTTDSGDYVLVAARTAAPGRTAETLAGYALLANGDLLCVDVSGGSPINAQDSAFCLGLLRSVDLAGTDGRALEQRLWANHPKLRGAADLGIAVLDDLTAWMLSDQATSADAGEMDAWAKGSAIHVQVAGERHELMRVGRWMAVPVRSLGVATDTTISDYDPASRRLSFSNGQQRYLPLYSKLPGNWALGDPVLIVRDQATSWLIWSNTMYWMQM